MIGLFDSGLGGLTVLRSLRAAAPHEHYTYLGDNARFPYGTKSQATIQRYARECAKFLLNREVELIIVACNTASAAALDQLKAESPVPVIGTVEPAVRVALKSTSNGHIGILGTNATVASGVYQRVLSEQREGLKITAQPCPLFVPLVEAGMSTGQIVELTVDLYCRPLKEAGVDTVILGCTHYPLLADPLRRYFGDAVRVVECSEAIAEEVSSMRPPPVGALSEGSESYFVTDEVGIFNNLASLFLDRESVQAVRVESLV